MFIDLTDIGRSLSFQSLTRNMKPTLASNVLDLAEPNRNSMWSNIPFSHNVSAYHIRTKNAGQLQILKFMVSLNSPNFLEID